MLSWGGIAILHFKWEAHEENVKEVFVPQQFWQIKCTRGYVIEVSRVQDGRLMVFLENTSSKEILIPYCHNQHVLSHPLYFRQLQNPRCIVESLIWRLQKEKGGSIEKHNHTKVFGQSKQWPNVEPKVTVRSTIISKMWDNSYGAVGFVCWKSLRVEDEYSIVAQYSYIVTEMMVVEMDGAWMCFFFCEMSDPTS